MASRALSCVAHRRRPPSAMPGTAPASMRGRRRGRWRRGRRCRVSSGRHVHHVSVQQLQRVAHSPRASPAAPDGGGARRRSARDVVLAARLTAQSRKSCSSTSCWAWLPPRRCMPASAGRIRSQARAGSPLARARIASHDRQRIVAHQRPDAALAAARCRSAHRLDHASGRLPAPGGGQRHHPVRQREGRQAIADARLGLVGELDPAIADIDTLALAAGTAWRRRSARRCKGRAAPGSAARRGCGSGGRRGRAPRRTRARSK